MPYIKREHRDKLDPVIEELYITIMQTMTEHDISGQIATDNKAGGLNYVITRLLHKMYLPYGITSYKSLNEALGVLNAVNQEFYRRKVAPYEDKKIEENGDV